MAAPTKEYLAAVVAAIEAKGMRVVHADKHAHHGRMLTVVVDEGDQNAEIIFEIWPEDMTAQDVADIAASAVPENGTIRVCRIGRDPRHEDA